jgi:hypothetical protein
MVGPIDLNGILAISDCSSSFFLRVSPSILSLAEVACNGDWAKTGSIVIAKVNSSANFFMISNLIQNLRLPHILINLDLSVFNNLGFYPSVK